MDGDRGLSCAWPRPVPSTPSPHIKEEGCEQRGIPGWGLPAIQHPQDIAAQGAWDLSSHPPAGHPGWVGWGFSTAASFMTQLCSALFDQPWPLLIYPGKQEPCTQPLKKEPRQPILGLTSHTVPCGHSIQFWYFGRKGGVVATWQGEGPLIRSFTHSFAHAFFTCGVPAVCLAPRKGHSKGTVLLSWVWQILGWLSKKEWSPQGSMGQFEPERGT